MVLIVVHKFKFVAPFFPVDLDRAVAVRAKNVVTRFLITVQNEIRVTDRTTVLFHEQILPVSNDLF